MVRWQFDNDTGKSHTFLIPGALYVPQSPARLFSPQHWAQTSDDHAPKRDGTWQKTLSDRIILVWGQEQYRREVALNAANVAVMHTTGGNKKYRAFATHVESTQGPEPFFHSFPATEVTDDEADSEEEEVLGGRYSPQAIELQPSKPGPVVPAMGSPHKYTQIPASSSTMTHPT